MYARHFLPVFVLSALTVLTACGNSGSKGSAAAPTANGSARSANAPEAAGASILGIAVYPRSETLQEPHRLTGDQSGTMYDSTFKSADKPEQVAAFYREALTKLIGDKTKIVDAPGGEGMIHIIASDGADKNFELLIRPDGTDTIFSIRSTVRTH